MIATLVRSRLQIGLLALTVSLVALCLQVSASQASTLSPQACVTHGNVHYSLGAGDNTANYVKTADGCASPWIIPSNYNEITGWVYYSGGWHGSGVDCSSSCQVWPGSWSYNGDNFHIQGYTGYSLNNSGTLDW